MNYLSTSAFESKLLPGVIFHLKKMSHGRRMEFNRMGAPVFQKLNELSKQREPFQEEVERAESAAKIEPCTCSHPPMSKDSHHETTGRCFEKGCNCRKPEYENDADRKLRDLETRQLEVLIDELAPAKLKWGVSSIEGLEIDGRPATIDMLLSDMPEAVTSEVVNEIDRLMRLSPEETLAFKSPTTGAAAVDGETPSSSAALAGGTATI